MGDDFAPHGRRDSLEIDACSQEAEAGGVELGVELRGKREERVAYLLSCQPVRG